MPFYPPFRTSLLSCSLLAFAQTSWADSTQVDLDTMQVWGTAVKSSTGTVREEEIEVKQADHLSDLLRDQAGVDIGGAHSTNQRINIRGVQDTQLEVTIDGARQNNFMYHHMGNLLINADILKEVDVRVGTNSVVNGGLSGGVAFETKDAKDLLPEGQDVGARVYGSYASNDYAGYSLTGYGQVDKQFDALAYFNMTKRNNPENGAGVESIGNDGNLHNGLVKLGWDVSDKQRLELTYDQYRDEGDYAPRPDMGAATNSAITANVVYPTEFERRTLTLNHELDLGDKLDIRTTIYRNEMDLWRDEALNTLATTYRYADGTASHTGAKVLAETLFMTGEIDHALRYGFDFYRQETEYAQDSIFISGESARSLALFVEDEFYLPSGLTITPGVRYNRYTLDSKASNETFSEFTWGLAAEYAFNQQWSVNASTTRLFQGPMLAEVFTGAGNTLQYNADLKPTTGFNNQLGLAYADSQVLGMDSVGMSLTVFQTRYYDYIDDEGGGSYVNLGDFDVDGFEASMNMRKGAFSGRLSYARSESENRITGEPMGRQVGDSIVLGLGYAIPRYKLKLNWQSLVTLKEDYYGKPAYDVHNISMTWMPRQVKNLSITFGIENLFDEYYVSHASRVGDTIHPRFGALHLNDYEPGRNIKLSASYSF